MVEPLIADTRTKVSRKRESVLAGKARTFRDVMTTMGIEPTRFRLELQQKH
jgi:hypothetical protein